MPTKSLLIVGNYEVLGWCGSKFLENQSTGAEAERRAYTGIETAW
jgi:hypothetical protein